MGEPDGDAEPGREGALARLLETERHVAELVRESEAAAERLLEEARDAAREYERSFELRLAEALECLRIDIEAERDRALAELGARADAEAERQRAVSAQTVSELADAVVARLVGLPERP
jgi:F0F1-type ATP synthase membrane subunit b/b'